MEKAKWMIGLLAIALLAGSCATFEDAKASMKKTFPGRVDNQATTDSNPRK
jgi:PBP1b-binding outer membrane lipoprotein LpoB